VLIWGPTLFTIFTNDPAGGSERTLGKFAGDTQLGGEIAAVNGCAAAQGDLGRLEKQANGNPMKLNKGRIPDPAH